MAVVAFIAFPSCFVAAAIRRRGALFKTAGLDIGLTESGLALNFAARYSMVEADFVQLAGASMDFDPLVAPVGLGWKF
jgi:outer membrane protein W